MRSEEEIRKKIEKRKSELKEETTYYLGVEGEMQELPSKEWYNERLKTDPYLKALKWVLVEE